MPPAPITWKSCAGRMALFAPIAAGPARLTGAVQPQMNTDGHGFAAYCGADSPYPQGRAVLTRAALKTGGCAKTKFFSVEKHHRPPFIQRSTGRRVTPHSEGCAPEILHLRNSPAFHSRRGPTHRARQRSQPKLRGRPGPSGPKSRGGSGGRRGPGRQRPSNSHYGPVTPRRVRAPGLHPPQNRHLVGRAPSPGFPISSIMRIAASLLRSANSLDSPDPALQLGAPLC